MNVTTNDAPLLRLDDLPVGALRLARVDGHKVCLARTAEGVFAVDHACPHEGYGLTQGSLDGNLLTCAWHNWKFDVSTGECVLGEEGVLRHDVEVDAGGGVRIHLRTREPAAERVRLTASLRSGIEHVYTGQIARDVVRLLRADADPGNLVWEAIAHGAPRAEFGWGHSVASATDCLSMLDLYEGDQRALPIVQAIFAVAEVARDRPVQPLPDPAPLPADAGSRLRDAVEREQLEEAQSLVRGAIEAGTGPDELSGWFTAAVSDHLLSYGHGAIYAQKAFELLDHLGWDRADTVLAHLVPTIVYGTREDTLPYLRAWRREVDALDLGGLADAALDGSGDWDPRGPLLDTVLADRRTDLVAAAVGALKEGAGVDGLLDTAVLASSERMLRYDVTGEHDLHDDFGWLDITHGLTFAHAVRWHHRRRPGPDTLRLALQALWLAQWTGRHEWHTRVGDPDPTRALGGDLRSAGEALQREALLDGLSTPIVHAHGVKTSRAASLEAERLGSDLPLLAVARFLDSPRLERFVASSVTASIDLLTGRAPRD